MRNQILKHEPWSSLRSKISSQRCKCTLSFEWTGHYERVCCGILLTRPWNHDLAQVPGEQNIRRGFFRVVSSEQPCSSSLTVVICGLFICVFAWSWKVWYASTKWPFCTGTVNSVEAEGGERVPIHDNDYKNDKDETCLQKVAGSERSAAEKWKHWQGKQTLSSVWATKRSGRTISSISLLFPGSKQATHTPAMQK